MDSLSQLALGAAVGVAVMGRRSAVWKAALWGGIAGTLPDLDALINHGDAVRNMVLHRAHSHGLFWLTLGAAILAWLASWLHGENAHFKRWWLALWLAAKRRRKKQIRTVIVVRAWCKSPMLRNMKPSWTPTNCRKFNLRQMPAATKRQKPIRM